MGEVATSLNIKGQSEVDHQESSSIQATQNHEISIYSEEDDDADNVTADDEEPPIADKYEEDQSNNGKMPIKEVLVLSFTSLGAIYGDLGTSPLYVLNSIDYPNKIPTKDDIYGAISLIFYIFVFIVMIKYALVVLVIGSNNSEGGQVAIYAKIARHLKIGPQGVEIPGAPVKNDLELLARQDTNSSFISHTSFIKSGSKWKNQPHVIKFISHLILICCFLGCSLVFSDGLLTPTTSILSAIAGIQLADPSFTAVLGVSEAVIVALFVIQQFGSHKISFVFAPLIAIWLIGLVICGIYNIARYDPGIWRALNPWYAIHLLKGAGIDALSGAMLSITGTEAMFADLGHFGRLPTQIGISVVFVCLIICYLGQGAYVVKHPAAIENPFFYSIPGGTNSWSYWIMFVLATISTIIASQALILGVFSIVSQLINLDCFPRFKVKHVSAKYVGKVYIPIVNFMLLVGVCCTAAGFKNSNNVTAAYGLGINLDFLVTTVLILVCMVYVYEFHFMVPVVFAMVFLPLEVVLVVSNLKKVPHGAWFPLVMAALSFVFLTFWRYGRSKVVKQQMESRVKLRDIYPAFRKKEPQPPVFELRGRSQTRSYEEDEEEENASQTEHDDEFGISLPQLLTSEMKELEVSSRFGKAHLKTFDGIGIIHVDSPYQILSTPNTVPAIYERLVSNFQSIPSVIIFVTTRTLSIPSVPNEDRVLVGAMAVPGHYKCVVRMGFMEEPIIDDSLIQHILNQIPEVTEMDIRLHQFSPLKNRPSDSGTEIPMVHFFENNRIRSHDYNADYDRTKNPLTITKRILRKFVINSLYSPLESIFKVGDEQLRISDESKEVSDKIFIGGVVKI